MDDSYFLHSVASGEKKFKDLSFKYFGCCETAGSWFMNSTLIYELISLKEIDGNYLKDPALIEEYLNLVSEFLDISIKRVSNPSLDYISNRTSIVSEGLTEKKWNEEYVCFELGKYHSNKHFVAMHTLIRYLWYGHYGYHSIVNAAVNLRRISPELPIEDVFAIAHSFQERNNRALTGKLHAKTLGFMYFKKKEEYLRDLKKDSYFNSIFDSFEINLVPSIKIKGNFFEESEINLNIKHFISFLTDLDNASPLISKKMFNEVLRIYDEYRPVYLEISKKLFNTIGSSRYRVLRCDILVDDSILSKIEFDVSSAITGRNSSHVLKNVEELTTLLNDLTKEK